MAGYAPGGGSSFTAKHNSLAKTLPAASIDTLPKPFMHETRQTHTDKLFVGL